MWSKCWDWIFVNVGTESLWYRGEDRPKNPFGVRTSIKNLERSLSDTNIHQSARIFFLQFFRGRRCVLRVRTRKKLTYFALILILDFNFVISTYIYICYAIHSQYIPLFMDFGGVPEEVRSRWWYNAARNIEESPWVYEKICVRLGWNLQSCDGYIVYPPKLLLGPKADRLLERLVSRIWAE